MDSFTRPGRGPAFLVTIGMLLAQVGTADDWPMWRRDAGRRAQSAESLPATLHLRWVRELPRLQPAYRQKRLQFDAGYEPVVRGTQMFVASSRTDSVTALDTETGEVQWEFFAQGPIRLAPAAGSDYVVFGADDGYLYCVAAADGQLRWRFQAVPAQRKVLGNGRMISLWPVRGGPVLHDGKVYFAAGVWSFEGVFVYCLDAATGKVVWRSDEASYVYGQHPHDAKAMGGVSPQGYLAVSGDDLIVPCGQALPAHFALATGKLRSFELPKPGRQPGGWFLSAAARRGEVELDAEVNRDLHEDKVKQGPGLAGVRSSITIGGKALQFADKFPGVEGEIHTLLAADEKLFVVDVEGRIYCLGDKPDRVARHGLPRANAPVDNAAVDRRLEQVLNHTTARRGYVFVPGTSKSTQLTTRAIIDALLCLTDFHVVATEDDSELSALQRAYRDQRSRVCLLSDDENLELPSYFASLIVDLTGKRPEAQELELLRPHSGVGCFLLTEEDHAQVARKFPSSQKEFSVARAADLTIVRRGELPGSVDYTGGWSSPDERVRAPLGVLWFDDTLGHFKRSPQPWFVDGVMISYSQDWMEKHRTERKPPYDLLPPVFSDVYTGRILGEEEAIVSGLRFPKRDLNEAQPLQYRPPTQRDDWNPPQPTVGERINPLTGKKEPRAIAKSYGCDGGVDYGYIFTMRSGTPAFYDKRMESGVCSISGPRSGCTNSIIPACGVLNVPYFYEGCTCSYPLPVGLAMVHRPQRYEQWSSWGPGTARDIERVGINFGAPGDRMTDTGTLWLGYPSRGRPSPEVSLSVEPKSVEYFYQHSLFVKGDDVQPWVAASGVIGASTIKLEGIREGVYTVRLYFLEPTHGETHKRTFDIEVNRQIVAQSFDIAQSAGGPLRSVQRQCDKVQIDGVLQINLTAREGQTVLSGVEVVQHKED